MPGFWTIVIRCMPGAFVNFQQPILSPKGISAKNVATRAASLHEAKRRLC